MFFISPRTSPKLGLTSPNSLCHRPLNQIEKNINYTVLQFELFALKEKIYLFCVRVIFQYSTELKKNYIDHCYFKPT